MRASIFLRLPLDTFWCKCQCHSAHPLFSLLTRRFFANVQLVWVGKHPLLNKFITLFFFTKMAIMQRRDDNIAFELPLNRPWTPYGTTFENTHEQGWFLLQLCLALTPPARSRKGLRVSVSRAWWVKSRKCQFKGHFKH
jgi:hypothetical protein